MMDQDTNRAIADRIAADLREIDENHPEYPASQRAFLADCERGFRGLAEEKNGYPVEGSTSAPTPTVDPVQCGGVAEFRPENAVVASGSDLDATDPRTVAAYL